MPTLPHARERPFHDQIGQIPGGCRRRRAGDGHIILRAQSALEALNPLPEHSRQYFLLTLIEAPEEPIIEARLSDEEIHQAQRIGLGIED